jgi:hypothetical protein
MLKPHKPVTSGDNIILIELSEGSGILAKGGGSGDDLLAWNFAAPTFRFADQLISGTID